MEAEETESCLVENGLARFVTITGLVCLQSGSYPQAQYYLFPPLIQSQKPRDIQTETLKDKQGFGRPFKLLRP